MSLALRTTIIRALLVATAAATTIVALALSAAPASAGTWGLGMRVRNQSPYELVYKTTQAKNVDKWIQAPDVPASAGRIGPLSESVFIKYQQNTPFGDTWARVIWDVRRDGVSVGELSYVVRVICNVGCAFDYSRSTAAAVTPGNLLSLSWKDNGATPGAGYYGELTVTPPSRGVQGAFVPPPTLSSCAPPRGIFGRASQLETVALRCGVARAAVQAGSAAGARWSTPGWTCARRTLSGPIARVSCKRGEQAFTFRWH